MFAWLLNFFKKRETELVVAPNWMFPIGSLFHHEGSGIYRITQHKIDQLLKDSVICYGTLELSLIIPRCAAAKLQTVLNQTECKCDNAPEHLKKFHNGH